VVIGANRERWRYGKIGGKAVRRLRRVRWDVHRTVNPALRLCRSIRPSTTKFNSYADMDRAGLQNLADEDRYLGSWPIYMHIAQSGRARQYLLKRCRRRGFKSPYAVYYIISEKEVFIRGAHLLLTRCINLKYD
jgi:hypothetical protein